MKIFAIIYSILICQCLMVYGQNSNQHINIKALSFKVSFDKLYSFNIDIYRIGNDIKIVYSVLDSNAAKILYDSLEANYSIRAFYTSTDSIATKKRLYKKDSISFSQNNDTSYKSLLDSCFLKEGHQFINKNPDLVHVGSPIYHWAFEENGSIVKKLGAALPIDAEYPLLRRLIIETFALYKPNSNNFLNYDNTNHKYHKG
jgi:hypothetical protein